MKKRIAAVMGRAFAAAIRTEPVDAAELHPTMASRSSAEEVAAGLAAELADVTVSPASTSRKKATQIGRRGLRPIKVGARTFGLRLVRVFTRSKLGTWRDSETRLRKHRDARRARVRREKAARRASTNGRRAAQG